MNLCEMKFASEKFTSDAGYAAHLRETGVRGNCHLTFVTTYGLCRSSYNSMVLSEVTFDDLFEE
ncbi:MAG: hypothetical protein J6Z49_08930 [Kiritimatiellae bacterium]|nr:hypothetical protein [Kiritimatiellia bacterium]